MYLFNGFSQPGVQLRTTTISGVTSDAQMRQLTVSIRERGDHQSEMRLILSEGEAERLIDLLSGALQEARTAKAKRAITGRVRLAHPSGRIGKLQGQTFDNEDHAFRVLVLTYQWLYKEAELRELGWHVVPEPSDDDETAIQADAAKWEAAE